MGTANIRDRRWGLPLLGLFLALLSGCDSATPDVPELDLAQRTVEPATREARPRTDNLLRFGFDPRASLEEDTRQYLPFLAYLERATGLRFKLHFSGDVPIAEELGEGTVDFAAIGATSYILARERHQAIPLVRGLNALDKAEYQSKIVVRVDSPIRTLSALRGRRFAFGNVDSTQGHLIPRILLSQAGLTLEDLGSYVYTGSHRNCADTVVSGKADACGMQDTLADLLVAQGRLRVLVTSDYFPSSGIAASPRTAPQAIEKVRQALLAFDPTGKHRAGLYNWEQTEMPLGFTAASPGDYAELRRWMIRFDMLQRTPAAAGSPIRP